MDFKEIFQRYQQGNAGEEESQYVQQELEKWKLIEEYLENQEDWISSLEIHADPSEIQHIQKKVKRKFAAAAVIAASVAVLIIFLWLYAIPPIINRMYYNPNEGYQSPYGDSDGQFYLDVSTYTELHFPGKGISSARAVLTAPGEYQIEIRQVDYFHGGEPDVFTASLKKGSFFGFSPLFWSYPYINAFATGNYPKYPQTQEDLDYIKAELSALPETAFGKAYISFKEDVDMETVLNIKKELDIHWVGVRISPQNRQSLFLGFEPSGNGLILEEGVPDESRFPYFELAHAYGEDGLSAEALEIHFQSLLRYLISRTEFLAAMGKEATEYDSALAYTEEHGVSSYGILVSGSCDDLLELVEEPWVSAIHIDDVKLSSFSH